MQGAHTHEHTCRMEHGPALSPPFLRSPLHKSRRPCRWPCRRPIAPAALAARVLNRSGLSPHTSITGRWGRADLRLWALPGWTAQVPPGALCSAAASASASGRGALALGPKGLPKASAPDPEHAVLHTAEVLGSLSFPGLRWTGMGMLGPAPLWAQTPHLKSADPKPPSQHRAPTGDVG